MRNTITEELRGKVLNDEKEKARTRVFAALLAGFSLASAFLFHANFADQIQSIMFMKNVGLAGGFLLLVVNGAGAWSLDAWRERGHGTPLAASAA